MTEDVAPILDGAVLDDLRASTGDDDEFMRDLVTTYVEEAGRHLEAIRAAAAAGDAEAAVRPAHTLKSSSASIGAMRLSAIGREIEAAGREGRTEFLARDAEAAGTTWDATLEALEAAGLVG